MACGTPVVCSDCASLPEVAGDAALRVDPRDHGALGRALLRVLSDTALAEDLAARGLARVRQRTWAETARRTLAAYRTAAADSA